MMNIIICEGSRGVLKGEKLYMIDKFVKQIIFEIVNKDKTVIDRFK